MCGAISMLVSAIVLLIIFAVKYSDRVQDYLQRLK